MNVTLDETEVFHSGLAICIFFFVWELLQFYFYLKNLLHAYLLIILKANCCGMMFNGLYYAKLNKIKLKLN